MRNETTLWSTVIVLSSWMWMETIPVKCLARLTSAMNMPRWKSLWRHLVVMVRSNEKLLEICTEYEVTPSGTLYRTLFPLHLPTGEFFLWVTRRGHFCTGGEKHHCRMFCLAVLVEKKAKTGTLVELQPQIRVFSLHCLFFLCYVSLRH